MLIIDKLKEMSDYELNVLAAETLKPYGYEYVVVNNRAVKEKVVVRKADGDKKDGVMFSPSIDYNAAMTLRDLSFSVVVDPSLDDYADLLDDVVNDYKNSNEVFPPVVHMLKATAREITIAAVLALRVSQEAAR